MSRLPGPTLNQMPDNELQPYSNNQSGTTTSHHHLDVPQPILPPPVRPTLRSNCQLTLYLPHPSPVLSTLGPKSTHHPDPINTHRQQHSPRAPPHHYHLNPSRHSPHNRVPPTTPDPPIHLYDHHRATLPPPDAFPNTTLANRMWQLLPWCRHHS